MTGSGKKKLSTPARGKSKSAKSGDGDGREKKGVVARAASRVGRAIRSVTAKVRPAAKAKQSETSKTPRTAKAAPKAARATRRDSDIPMDRIAETYTPEHTSVKSGMRGNGAGNRNDRNVGSGIDDDRWNDEDIITNKSGDPRIGTHGRTYEPGEARAVAANGRK